MNIKKAFWYMTIAAFSGAVIAASMKAMSFQISVAVIFFFTRVLILLGAIPVMWRHGFKLFQLKYILEMGVMSLLYVLAFYCYFYSFLTTPLSIASLLMNSSPLYVPIFAYFILKTDEIKSKMLWICMGISFAGVILILAPHGEMHLKLFGVFLALMSGILLSASQVSMKLATENINPDHAAFFQAIFSIVFTAIPATFILWHAPAHYLQGFMTIKNVSMLVLCGIASWLFQLYRAKAFSVSHVSVAMPFGYLGVVFVGILDAIFWDVIPGVISITGMVLVVAGVVLLLYTRRQ